MMPLITRRSSTRRAPAAFFGSKGSIADHCSSFSQNPLFIIKASVHDFESEISKYFNRLIEFSS
jgi:hypothetical protein